MAIVLDGTSGITSPGGDTSSTSYTTPIVKSASSLTLQTNGSTTAVTIDTSQNVGIGTASPNSKLEVTSRITASDGGGASRIALNIESNTSAQTYSAINSYNYGTSTARNLVLNESGGNVGIGTISPGTNLQINSATGGAIRLQYTGNSGYGQVETNANNELVFKTSGANERMRIDSSGNLLVGCTTTPTSGGIGAAFQSGPSVAGNMTLTFRANTTSAYEPVYFYNPNGLVGYIRTSASTTTYSTSSDYRLKENIAPMTGALATVAKLKPVTYKWKVDGSDGQGFIAHELQAVVPDCVSGEKDAVDADGNPKYQGIDTSFLVATLTAAIQEQQAIINELKSRIETLESK